MLMVMIVHRIRRGPIVLRRHCADASQRRSPTHLLRSTSLGVARRRTRAHGINRDTGGARVTAWEFKEAVIRLARLVVGLWHLRLAS